MKGPESSQQFKSEKGGPTPEDIETADGLKEEIVQLFAEANRLPHGFRRSQLKNSDLAISPEGYVVGVPKDGPITKGQ